jgi:hypothetical protein
MELMVEMCLRIIFVQVLIQIHKQVSPGRGFTSKRNRDTIRVSLYEIYKGFASDSEDPFLSLYVGCYGEWQNRYCSPPPCSAEGVTTYDRV